MHEPTPIEQLFDKLGAEVAINLKRYQPMPLNKMKAARVMVENELLDMGVGERYLPDWARSHGVDQRSTLVCVWDKPVPFKAGHRKWMMRCIQATGVWEDQVTHVWAVPEDLESVPLPSQFLKYREVVLRAIEAADSRYVLLIGAGPLGLWRPDLKLKEVVGSSGVMENRWVAWAMVNPITVLREPMLQGQWRQDIYTFMDMIRENEEFNLMTKCVHKGCANGVLMYDKDGIGYCSGHWRKDTAKWDRAASKMKTKSRKLNEDQLDL